MNFKINLWEGQFIQQKISKGEKFSSKNIKTLRPKLEFVHHTISNWLEKSQKKY